MTIWGAPSKGRRRVPRVAATTAAVLFAAAALAPFVAGSRPLFVLDDGHLEFPAIRALQAADVAWLVALLVTAAWFAVPRRLRRPWAFSLALALGLASSLLVPRHLPSSRPISAGSASEGALVVLPPIPHGPTDNDLSQRLLPPSSGHWLGTDGSGRDVLALIVHGARVSLLVGLAAVLAYTAFGIVAGALAGYLGGIVDGVVSRLAEVLLSFPILFAVLVAAAFLPPSASSIVVVLGIFGWPHVARLVRAECLRLREEEFVLAARALGASHLRVLARHVVPGALGPVVVAATFGVAAAILTETALSFLGLGIREPEPSWGHILALGREQTERWWLSVFPGAAIFVTVLATNAIGERLREALDPRRSRALP